MTQIIDIVRAGPGALHLYVRVSRKGWLNRLLGRSQVETYTRLGRQWYDCDGWRVQPGPILWRLEGWHQRWDEGKNPVILWDEV